MSNTLTARVSAEQLQHIIRSVLAHYACIKDSDSSVTDSETTITNEIVRLVMGQSPSEPETTYRALCSCGWSGVERSTHAEAEHSGSSHAIGMARTVAPGKRELVAHEHIVSVRVCSL